MLDFVTKMIKKASNGIKNDRSWLYALLPCAPALLLFVLTCQNPQPFPDSGDYLALAQNLAAHAQYHVSLEDTDGLLALMRSPGYPALIAMASFIAGNFGYFLVNLLCLYGIGVLTIKLGREWGMDKCSWLLPLFLLTSPALIVMTSVALTEVPFTFWLMLGLFLLCRNRPLEAGLSLSMATIIRPAGIYLFAPLALWMLWQRKKIIYVLIFAAAANLLPLAWCTCNYIRTGYFTFTTMEGYYMLYYKAGSFLSKRDNIPFDAMCRKLDTQLTAENPVERSRQAYVLGKKIIIDNMPEVIFWMQRDVPYFLMPDINPLLERLQLVSGNRGTLDILRRQGAVAALKHYFSGNPAAAIIALVYMVFYTLCWLLMLFGIWSFYRRRDFAALGLTVLCIAYFWVLPIGNLDWRFRIPALPLIFIFFTSGAIYLNDVRRKMSNKKGVV